MALQSSRWGAACSGLDLCHCGLPAAAVRKMFSAFCPIKILDWIWTTLTT